MVITGGPGTGKTTVINCIIRLLNRAGLTVALAAPTGRAAKRMTEATGQEARTIHRLLEYAAGEDDGLPLFGKTEEDPLKADAVIVDEMSMVDLQLMRSLLKAIPAGTRLIMVGDADQLPSVGAGNVLRDIIESRVIPVARLTEVFRQAAQSHIVVNAHRINSGEMPIIQNRDTDFFFEKRESLPAIADSVCALVTTRLPRFYSIDPVRDIQVLAPMKKGEAGVWALNRLLQERLNPPSKHKKEKVIGDNRFREGDKVMQVRNNYQAEWTRGASSKEEEGLGVFNGDIGIIESISDDGVTVLFDDERYVVYDDVMLQDLELAYAMTIHKSQGSEFSTGCAGAAAGAAADDGAQPALHRCDPRQGSRGDGGQRKRAAAYGGKQQHRAPLYRAVRSPARAGRIGCRHGGIPWIRCVCATHCLIFSFRAASVCPAAAWRRFGTGYVKNAGKNCASRPQADGRALAGSTICAVSMLTTVLRGS